MSILKYIWVKLQNIVSIGTTNSLSPQTRSRIILTNSISLLLSLLSLPYVPVFHVTSAFLLRNIAVVVVFSFTVSIILNYYHQYYRSKISLLLTTNFTVLYYSISLGQNGGVQYVLFAFVFLPFVIFEPYQIKQIIIGTIAPLFNLIGILLYTSNHLPIYELPPTITRSIYYTAINATYIILTASIFFFRHAYEHTENELRVALTEAIQRKLMLEKASQQQSFATLTRGIAHEIKNPMAMILTGIELVIDNINNKEQTLKFSEMVKENILRLKSITSTMLKYGTPVSEKREQTNLNEVLTNALYVAQAECKKRFITLEKKFGELPLIETNPDALHQVFLNFILNSIEAIETDGKITVTSEQVDSDHPFKNHKKAIKIEFTDTGAGIEKEKIEHIFDPFYSNKYGNTGLGLSIVIKTVHDLDGELTVKSELNKFTTFTVFLPRKESETVKNKENNKIAEVIKTK